LWEILTDTKLVMKFTNKYSQPLVFLFFFKFVDIFSNIKYWEINIHWSILVCKSIIFYSNICIENCHKHLSPKSIKLNRRWQTFENKVKERTNNHQHCKFKMEKCCTLISITNWASRIALLTKNKKIFKNYPWSQIISFLYNIYKKNTNSRKKKEQKC